MNHRLSEPPDPPSQERTHTPSFVPYSPSLRQSQTPSQLPFFFPRSDLPTWTAPYYSISLVEVLASEPNFTVPSAGVTLQSRPINLAKHFIHGHIRYISRCKLGSLYGNGEPPTTAAGTLLFF